MRKLILCGQEIPSLRILASSAPTAQYAAAELMNYLNKAAGIVPSDGGALAIRVETAPTMPKDGYCISLAPNEITVRGNNRGVIYGVYAFLERYVGCRFFTPDLECYGNGDIVIDEGFSHAPVIAFRQSDWICGRDVDWRVKNGLNDRFIPAEKGGYTKMSDEAGCHTMELLLGTDQYHAQPCLTDPENLKTAIRRVRELLNADPDATIFSVSQNDNSHYCTCERCAAVDAEEGSHMGSLLRFVNAIADDIREDYPHVTIDTLAYVYTRQAPRITRPAPNVCIRLCSIECCFSHPLDDPTCPENRQFHNDILAWNRICDNLYIWDYVVNFRHYIPPFPNFGVLRENMRFFADHGVKGMYPEGNYQSPLTGEFGELRCYLLAKLMMDPHMSTTAYYRHMDEFLAAYYGGGWLYIRAFIDFLTMEAKGRHVQIYNHPFTIIPADRYRAMESTIDAWWDTAEEMAGDRLECVRRSRMHWRYIKLMLHPNEAEGKAFLADVERYRLRWCEVCPYPNDVDFTKTPDTWWNPKKPW